MRNLLDLLWRKKRFTLKLMLFNFLFFLGSYIIFNLIDRIAKNQYVFKEAAVLSPVTKVGMIVIMVFFYFLLPLVWYSLVKFHIMKSIAVFFKNKFSTSFNDFFSVNLKIWLIGVAAILVWDVFASGLQGKVLILALIISHIFLVLFFHSFFNITHRRLGSTHPITDAWHTVWKVKVYGKVFIMDFFIIFIPMAIITFLGWLFKIGYVERFGITAGGNQAYVFIYYAVLYIVVSFVLSFNQVYFYKNIK